MTTTALMTELEAVNIILEAVEEAPVQSLAVSGLQPLDMAQRTLQEASRLVQSTGWAFNTEQERTLTRDVSGMILVPDTFLRFDASDEYRPSIDPVQRGVKLYDRKGLTYVFSKDIKGQAVVKLEWAELPQVARYCIAVKAARIAQGRQPVSEAVYRYTAGDEESAFLALSTAESDEGDANMLQDSWSCSAILDNH